MPLDPRALVTLAEARDWLNVATSFTGDDSDIETAINTISQRIHQEAGREFKVTGTNPQTRSVYIGEQPASEPWYVDGMFMGYIGPTGRTVWVGDLTSWTTIRILSPTDWTTVLATPTTDQVRGLPLTRQEWEPITQLEFRPDLSGFGPKAVVEITGDWGFPDVPGSIKQAALDGVAWCFDRDVEHYRTDLGTVGGERGPVVMLSGGAQLVQALPPTAMAACREFRQRTVG